MGLQLWPTRMKLVGAISQFIVLDPSAAQVSRLMQTKEFHHFWQVMCVHGARCLFDYIKKELLELRVMEHLNFQQIEALLEAWSTYLNVVVGRFWLTSFWSCSTIPSTKWDYACQEKLLYSLKPGLDITNCSRMCGKILSLSVQVSLLLTENIHVTKYFSLVVTVSSTLHCLEWVIL